MIEVIRESDDDLNREVWQFGFMDYHKNPLVILERYYKQNRFTTRHRWISAEYYNRTGRDSSSDEVPLPDDVAQEALQKFMEQVKVVKELGIRVREA